MGKSWSSEIAQSVKVGEVGGSSSVKCYGTSFMVHRNFRIRVCYVFDAMDRCYDKSTSIRLVRPLFEVMPADAVQRVDYEETKSSSLALVCGVVGEHIDDFGTTQSLLDAGGAASDWTAFDDVFLAEWNRSESQTYADFLA